MLRLNSGLNPNSIISVLFKIREIRTGVRQRKVSDFLLVENLFLSAHYERARAAVLPVHG